MVDIHDRRPVAVSADDARHWLDPKLTTDEAMHIARTAMLDANLFEWHAVSTELNRGADGPHVAAPLISTEYRRAVRLRYRPASARKQPFPRLRTSRTKNRSKCVKMRQIACPLFVPPRQFSCAFGHGANLSQKSPI